MAPVRRHLRVSGRVQGVFFRSAVQEQALAAGVSGWIRNLPDGGVEAVLEGERVAVEQVVAFCRRGPPYARVDHVDIREEEFRGDLKGFAVRY
ncbi:MAG: acylphosphatase [Methanomicrobiales archaeon]|nr:acylphosphatase [Methanomicrobiales archaeon]